LIVYLLHRSPLKDIIIHETNNDEFLSFFMNVIFISFLTNKM